jgi:hypothetical protein
VTVTRFYWTAGAKSEFMDAAFVTAAVVVGDVEKARSGLVSVVLGIELQHEPPSSEI